HVVSVATFASDAARSKVSSGVAKALTGSLSAATSEARRPHSAGGTDLCTTPSTGSSSALSAGSSSAPGSEPGSPDAVMRPSSQPTATSGTVDSHPEVATRPMVQHEAAVEDHDAERR